MIPGTKTIGMVSVWMTTCVCSSGCICSGRSRSCHFTLTTFGDVKIPPPTAAAATRRHDSVAGDPPRRILRRELRTPERLHRRGRTDTLWRMREPLPYVVVDVFTDRPLEGNQLGVFTDARPLGPDQMQRLAREMNFAECTFVLPAERGGDARVRIFTPANELPFAGHPVLGTAFAIGEQKGIDVVRLETGLGVVPIELRREGGRIVFGR